MAIRVDGVANTRGIRAVGIVGGPAVPPSTVSYPGGTTASVTIPGLSIGAHTVTVTDIILESSGASSGGGFGSDPNFADTAGFDAWYNLTAGPIADLVGGTGTYQSIELTENISVVGVGTIGAATDVLANGTTSVPTAIPGGVATFRGGDDVVFAGGSGWAPSNNNLRVRICVDPAGTTCNPAFVPLGAVVGSVDGSGNLGSWTFDAVASFGAFSGINYLKVEQGANPGFSPLTASSVTTQINILGARTVVGPDPASAGNATITGANWYPGTTVAVETQDSGSATADGPVNAVATNAGTISTTLNLDPNNGGETYNASDAFGGSASLPFAYSLDRCVAYTNGAGNDPIDQVPPNGCFTSQNIEVSITAGSLTQRAYLDATATTGSAMASRPMSTPQPPRSTWARLSPRWPPPPSAAR